MSAKILQDFLTWAEAQFYALGFIKEASDHSLYLVASLQGVFLLSHVFKDVTLITRQIERLQDTLDALLTENRVEHKEVVAC